MKTLIFLGTPPMAAKLLEKLLDYREVQIVGVVTQPDHYLGRKRVLTPSPVALVAEKFNIPVHKPERLNKDYDFIADKHPDLLLTFAYGQLVATKVLELSRYPALNLHGSLLPLYRGAAPIQYALLNGETKTGISLMEMVKQMDAGAVYGTKEIAISSDDNYSSLAAKLTEVAYDVLVKCLPDFWAGKIVPQAQDENLATFCPSIKPEEEHLDLAKSKVDFINQIRALSDVPGGYLLSESDEKFKIFRAHIFDDEVLALTGTVVKAENNALILQLKDGRIALDVVQKAGKNKMEAASFNNGNNIAGTVLK